MIEFFTQFAPQYLPRLLKGAVVTLELSFTSMILSILVGLICAVAVQTRSRVAVWVVRVYVEICRGVPLLVILYFTYFLLPEAGIMLPAFAAAVLGLTFNLGAYLSEVFRASIEAVDKGQYQAGMALGMKRWAIYWKIILPQAMAIAIPTVGGYFISLLKDCSLVSVIAVDELLKQGKYIISENFRSVETIMLVGIIYFVMSFGAAAVIRRVERWLRPAYLG
ncbi:MAG TPA: amino acid ABC transporter permease [Dongiaceae bacterium]|nr:amino acid ABC transporter permease [Dongiaceae bacterium]